VISFDLDLKSKKVTNHPVSFLWEDEELDCEYFHNMDGSGCINCCRGNEPYSCHRAKKEGLCHKVKKK